MPCAGTARLGVGLVARRLAQGLKTTSPETGLSRNPLPPPPLPSRIPGTGLCSLPWVQPRLPDCLALQIDSTREPLLLKEALPTPTPPPGGSPPGAA